MNPHTQADHPPRVLTAIVDGPLTGDREAAALGAPGREPDFASGLAGASVRFAGVVRRAEPRDGRGSEAHEILALDYRTYDPMAERELRTLARSVAERHGLLSLAALHSRGRISVGEVSFVLIVESVHRAEALAAIAEFIDRMKQDVPIWKSPVWR
jgi:molybdopterin synthase catalytic subunit